MRSLRNPQNAAFTLLAALVLAHVGSGSAQCGSSSSYIGFEGQLTQFEHDLAGTVRILDDCTMQVSGFTYDGKGPAVFWWGAPSADNGDIRRDGRRVVGQQLDRAYNGETATFKLSDGLSWADFKVLSVWCEEFNADFGHVELKQGAAEAQAAPAGAGEPQEAAPEPVAAAPAPAPAPAPAAGLGLANCVELLPNYYNLHWEVVDSQVIVTLEGRVGGDNRWLGFGFAAENATDVLMPGSDVVVGGMVNGDCFGYDYSLESRLQCSYTERSGACPDFGLSGDRGSNQVELLDCTKVGDVLAVTMMRPLNASDQWDRAWPLDGSGFPVWAMGPVSEGSNADQPIVLYHRFQLPGSASEDTVHAPTGQDYRLNLGGVSAPSSCRPLLAEAEAAAATPAAAPSQGASAAAPAPRTPVVTLSGVTEFNVTEGDNPNYPNPPGWGVSYHINGMESPILSLTRGSPYTFRVMAGPNHPLYLTSSIVGGGSFSGFANETVYGGGEEVAGTEEAPYEFVWTPDASTPDTLYYQCTVHQKIGWEVLVADA